MSFILPAAMAVVGGITNMISGGAQAAFQQKQKEAATRILERAIVDDAELARMLRSTSRMFNAQLQNTINSTAVRSKGLANTGVVGAAAAGQVKAAEGLALSKTEDVVADKNARIYERMSTLQLYGTADDPVGNFAEGAVYGGIAGNEFSKTLGFLSKLDPTEETTEDPTEEEVG